MIAAPAALPLGRFGAGIEAPDREAVAGEIQRLSALLARLDRERRRAALMARPGLHHSRRKGDRTLPPEAVDELLERFGSGDTMTAIARAMGSSKGAVSGRIHRLMSEIADWNDAQWDRLLELLADDVPVSEAAARMGVPASAAAAALARIRRDMGERAR